MTQHFSAGMSSFHTMPSNPCGTSALRRRKPNWENKTNAPGAMKSRQDVVKIKLRVQTPVTLRAPWSERSVSCSAESDQDTLAWDTLGKLQDEEEQLGGLRVLHPVSHGNRDYHPENCQVRRASGRR